MALMLQSIHRYVLRLAERCSFFFHILENDSSAAAVQKQIIFLHLNVIPIFLWSVVVVIRVKFAVKTSS